MLVGSVAVAVTMALSSAAFACTIWTGKMEVTAISTGPGNSSSGTVTGYGANMNFAPGTAPQGAGSSMQYCNGTQPTGLASVDQDPTTGLGTIDVTVASYECVDGNGSRNWDLASGPWQINWLPNPAYDCMKGTPIGSFVVPTGATTYTARTDAVPNVGFSSTTTGGYRPDAGKAAICADGPGIFGMQVPITVI